MVPPIALLNLGVSTMRDGSYPMSATVPSAFTSGHFKAKPKTKQKSVLAWLVAALHRARRIQARRILQQHRHLVADAKQREFHQTTSEIEGSENVGE
jgi:hypothetical protein